MKEISTQVFTEIEADRDLCRVACHSVLEGFEEYFHVVSGNFEQLRY